MYQILLTCLKMCSKLYANNFNAHQRQREQERGSEREREWERVRERGRGESERCKESYNVTPFMPQSKPARSRFSNFLCHRVKYFLCYCYVLHIKKYIYLHQVSFFKQLVNSELLKQYTFCKTLSIKKLYLHALQRD